MKAFWLVALVLGLLGVPAAHAQQSMVKRGGVVAAGVLGWRAAQVYEAVLLAIRSVRIGTATRIAVQDLASFKAANPVTGGLIIRRELSVAVKRYPQYLDEIRRLAEQLGIQFEIPLAQQAEEAAAKEGKSVENAPELTEKEKEILKEAEAKTGMYGLGEATAEEADRIGEAWVGPGWAPSRTKPEYKISKDKLRQYRPPESKPNGKVQANIERRDVPKGRYGDNGHLDITDRKWSPK